MHILEQEETSLVGLAGGCCMDFNSFTDHLFFVGTEEVSLSLSLSLPGYLALSHPLSLPHTVSFTHTRAHILSLSRCFSLCVCLTVQQLAIPHTPKNLTYTHTHAHLHAHTRTHTHTCTLPHTHTHTHTHLPAGCLLQSKAQGRMQCAVKATSRVQ